MPSTGEPDERDPPLASASLAEQLAFYFSDSNLAKDRFLRRELSATADLSMPVSVLLRFNRVAAHTSDAATVASALRHVDGLAVSDDGATVRRLAPLPEPRGFDSRTLYAESLPRNPTIESLSALFGRVGRVAYVSLPRIPGSQIVKGFCFVEFATDAEAASALARIARLQAADQAETEGAAPVPPAEQRAARQLKHLRVMTKQRWLDLRAEYVEYLAHLREAKRNRRPREPAETRAEPAVTPETPSSPDWPPNVIVRVEGISSDANSARIKEVLEAVAEAPGAVEYVDYKRKTTQCLVRMRDEGAARVLLARLKERPRGFDGDPATKEAEKGAMAARVLGGAEERAYWAKIAEAKEARKRKRGGGEGEAAAKVAVAELASAETTEKKKKKKKKSKSAGEPEEQTPAAGGANRKERRKALKAEHVHFASSDEEGEEQAVDSKDTAAKRQADGATNDAPLAKRQRSETQ